MRLIERGLKLQNPSLYLSIFIVEYIFIIILVSE